MERKLTHASVFSGIGGPEVAAEMLGWDNLFHCEINPFGRAVLDYWFPNAKSYEDITKTDFSEWRGKVDVLTGGFPCQPFSYAGKRRGAEDDRYLWPSMFRCIDQIKPAWVVCENVAGILTMVEQGEVTAVASEATLFDEDNDVQGYELRETFTLQRICDDLERHGYAVQPVLIPACGVGAPHRRDRVFIIGRRLAPDADIRADGGKPGSDAGAGETERVQERNEIRQPDFASQVRPASTGNVAAHAVGRGEGTPGAGGSIESNGGGQNQLPRQRGEQTQRDSGFYEFLRDAAHTEVGRSNGSLAGLSGSEKQPQPQLGNDNIPDAANANGEGLQKPGQPAVRENGAKTGAGQNDRTERPCELGRTTNAQRTGLEGQDNTGAEEADGEYLRGNAAGCDRSDNANGGGKFATHSQRNGRAARLNDNGRTYEARQAERGKIQSCGADSPQDWWRDFPTVPPVHRGNDGLPFPLDDLTISASKWRTESLKAYGNAIVPQVMYEIFRTIQAIENE